MKQERPWKNTVDFVQLNRTQQKSCNKRDVPIS